MLGERELHRDPVRGTQYIVEAEEAFQAALEERRRDRVPLDWAQTQSNLGATLKTIGEWEWGTQRLEEAVAALRAALGEQRRDRVPLEWARTQNILGAALHVIGSGGGDAAFGGSSSGLWRGTDRNTLARTFRSIGATSYGNQGVAISLIAARREYSAMARAAVEQIRNAHETLRAGEWIFPPPILKNSSVKRRRFSNACAEGEDAAAKAHIPCTCTGPLIDI